MKAELIARPTEYRGIQYRSKCEAMFAMWLDLKYGDNATVEYEPEWASDGDYTVDFSVHRPVRDGFHSNGIPMYSIHVDLIEYKPSKPTVSYCSETCKKLMRIATNAPCEIEQISRIMVMIIYGSVYTNDRGAFLCGFDDCQSIKLNWLGKYEKQIRDYRFDLECEA